MALSEDFIFTLHQYVASILALSFIYFAWRDQKANTFDGLPNVSPRIVASLLIGICLGLFGLFLYEWGAQAIVLALSYAILISMMLYDPKYAVSFYIFILISRPWEFFNDQLMLALPRDLFVLTTCSFLAHKIYRKRFYFQWNLASAFMLFYAVWTFFSIFPSAHPTEGLIGFSEVFIKGVLIYFLIVNVIDRKEYILTFQSAFVLAITEKSLISFYKLYFLKVMGVGERLVSVGILENSNDIAAIMILVLPFTLVIFKNIKNIYFRTILQGMILIFYCDLIWQSKSRGAILGIGMLVVAWFWLKAKSKVKATLIVFVVALIAQFAMSSIKRDVGDIEGSTTNRITYWKAGLKMGLKRPVFGVGYGEFTPRFFEYADGMVGSEGAYKTVHSTWILAWAESGAVGFLFYLGVWVCALRASWNMRYDRPEYILGILSYGMAITFLSHTYMLYPYILMALTVASGQFYIKKDR
jgi:O-antigen ligase